jgi:hypothetical protein
VTTSVDAKVTARVTIAQLAAVGVDQEGLVAGALIRQDGAQEGGCRTGFSPEGAKEGGGAGDGIRQDGA